MKKSYIVIGVVGLLAVIVTVSAVVVAQSVYTPAATKIMTVPACSFMPSNKDVDYAMDGTRLYLQSGTPKYIRAPLYLPNKAKLIKMVLVCKDDDAKDITVWLHRVSNDGTDSKAIAVAQSSGTGTNYRTFETASFSELKIDNENYCYFINLYLHYVAGEKLVLSHVKVYYKGNM